MNESAPFPLEQSAEHREAPARWRRPVVWMMLLAIGWVLYELTARPALGSVAVCLKFGWDDFSTAIWLRRRDPWRLRGRACFWLYQASGLWKVAIVAFLMSIAFVVISPKGQAAAQAPRLAAVMEVVRWTGAAAFIGLSSALLALCYALALGWWSGLKLWVSNDIHAARRHNHWPPITGACKRGNGARVIVLCGSWLLGLFLMVLGIIMGIHVPFGLLRPWMAGAEPILFPAWIMLDVIGGAVLILMCNERAASRLAQCPSECWGEHPDIENMTYPSGDTVE